MEQENDQETRSMLVLDHSIKAPLLRISADTIKAYILPGAIGLAGGIGVSLLSRAFPTSGLREDLVRGAKIFLGGPLLFSALSFFTSPEFRNRDNSNLLESARMWWNNRHREVFMFTLFYTVGVFVGFYPEVKVVRDHVQINPDSFTPTPDIKTPVPTNTPIPIRNPVPVHKVLT